MTEYERDLKEIRRIIARQGVIRIDESMYKPWWPEQRGELESHETKEMVRSREPDTKNKKKKNKEGKEKRYGKNMSAGKEMRKLFMVLGV